MRSLTSARAVVVACGIAAATAIAPRRADARPDSIEGEALVPAARAGRGAVTAQDMSAFGRGWSGGAQLLWRPAGPGARIVLPVRSVAAGVFDVALRLTQAPDYGAVEVSLGGKTARFDGHASAVRVGPPVRLEGVRLAAGDTPMTLVVAAKNPASTGHLVGLDRVDVEPAAGRTPATPVPPARPVAPTPPSLRPDATRLPAPFATVEGEATTPLARASGGRVVTESMARFGRGWAGGAQLVWSPAKAGDRLEVPVDVPSDGTYLVVVRFTKGPRFGRVRAGVEGTEMATFDGAASAVAPSGPVRLGHANLRTGKATLVLVAEAGAPGALVGIDRIELMRDDPGAREAPVGSPPRIQKGLARAVLPYAAKVKPIATGSIAVPYRDLRPYIKQKNLAIRDQGNRGTCSVFAVTFLLEYAYAKNKMNFGDLSEEYLNYASNLVSGNAEDGDFFSNLDAGFQTWGTYPEGLVPYQATFDPDYVVPQVYMDVAKKWPRFAADFVKAWDSSTGATQAQLDKTIAYLDQEVPVAAGLWWPVKSAWATTNVLGVDVMTTPPNKANLTDGHSIALVGYFKNPAFDGGGYFIFRNSWGTATFGDQGYGYMPFSYVLSYANDLLAYPP